MAYLWIHLAGLALLPLLLQIVWLGLAVSQPLPFFWLELVLLILIGLFPVAFLQFKRPFSPFNLLFFTLKIESLTEDYRRILTPLKSNRQFFISAIGCIISLITLWVLYQFAPLASAAASFLPQWRILGLLIALIGYFFFNLFFLVSLSVIPLILSKINTFEPYPMEKIKEDFFFFGIPLKKIFFENL